MRTYINLALVMLLGGLWHGASWPQCCDIFDALPRATTAYSEHNGDWISKTSQVNAVLLQAIDKYEKDLKAESFLTQFVLPPTQELLTYTGGGNEKGYVGRQRWLFYRPGIDYCTGLGFLDPQQMAAERIAARSGGPPRSQIHALRSCSSTGSLPSGISG